jgi:hypothetical protein
MGMTEIASRFNGWDKNAKRMRAVGTRLAPSFVAYLKARYPLSLLTYQPLKWLATSV